MKRVMLTLIVLMLACCSIARADDPNESVAIWLTGNSLGYHNSDLSLLIGYRADNTEIGVANNWRMYSEGDTDEDNQSIFAIGPYAAIHFPGVIDVNNPFVEIEWMEWMPEKLVGEPFLALSYLFDVKGNGTAIVPKAGVRLFDMFSLSYQRSFFNGNDAEDKGQVGISTMWRF